MVRILLCSCFGLLGSHNVSTGTCHSGSRSTPFSQRTASAPGPALTLLRPSYSPVKLGANWLRSYQRRRLICFFLSELRLGRHLMGAVILDLPKCYNRDGEFGFGGGGGCVVLASNRLNRL